MHFNVFPLFPSPVIQVNVEEDTSELLENNNYDAPCSRSEDGDVERSNIRVLERFPKTREILLNKFNSVAEQVIGYKKRNYAITTSWVTLCNRGEGSQLHRHKNSFWSGVYYFQKEYDMGTGGILFDSPNTVLSDFSFENNDIENYNQLNSTTYTFTPSPSLLLLFPSYLQHQVLNHNNDKPRSSLAFNIVPLGAWGEHDSSYDYTWVTTNANTI